MPLYAVELGTMGKEGPKRGFYSEIRTAFWDAVDVFLSQLAKNVSGLNMTHSTGMAIGMFGALSDEVLNQLSDRAGHYNQLVAILHGRHSYRWIRRYMPYDRLNLPDQHMAEGRDKTPHLGFIMGRRKRAYDYKISGYHTYLRVAPTVQQWILNNNLTQQLDDAWLLYIEFFKARVMAALGSTVHYMLTGTINGKVNKGFTTEFGLRRKAPFNLGIN